MAITPLPDPPERSDPDNFSTKADAFLGALPAFGTELNAALVDVEAVEDAASVANASVNFLGAWSNQSGAATVPASVSHNDQVWILKDDIANIATSEPGVSSDWIAAGTLTLEGKIVAVAAASINCSAGSYFTKTVAGNITFTFDSVPSGKAYSFILRVNHTSGTITWPASVEWPVNEAPSLTTGNTLRL